ncbi:MAG: DUF4859 domain-containing protein [Bacteroidales bacterium]|nr:DUF4859 domain-containing protein [Bacteroidales bacterium]
MKKFFYYAGALLFAGALTTTSCNKDDDNSSSDDDIKRRQQIQDSLQRVKDSLAQVVTADKILEYTCEITASETAYEGNSFSVDAEAIAKALGISVDEFILGIEGEAGGAEVSTYYIQGSTGTELIGTNTQVGPQDKGWGHWLNKDRDVTTWGESQAGDYSMTYAGQAVIFTSLHRKEKDSKEFICEIGQYPAKLTEAGLVGSSYVIKEGVKFDDTKVVLQITVNIKGLEALTAEVIETKDLSLTTAVYDSHEDFIELDSAAILAKLGASSLKDCKFVAIKADGSYAQEADDPALGLYWENTKGEACGYADGNFYIGYNHAADNENRGKIVIGQYGHKLVDADKNDFSGDFTAKWGVFYNNKVVMVNVKVTIASYEDPEKGNFTGTPANSSKDYSIEKEYTNDYAAVKVDVKEQLENTFQKTCYELYQAFQAGSLKFYAAEVTEADPEYTANKPGYWLSAEGKGVAYAEGVIYAELTLADYANQNIVFNIGNHPDNCKLGATIPLKIFATDGTTTAVMNINVTVGAAPAE